MTSTDDFMVFAIPFGNYLDLDAGIRCQTSTWRRVPDVSIPARAKVNGLYVNSALAKTEAIENGYDEAIMLNDDGHVSEGSGENIVIVRHGKLITPERSDNVLEGITLESVFQLARDELGHRRHRALDRPLGAVHRRRVLPDRHGRAPLARRRGRPAQGRQRRRRADHRRSCRRLFFDAIRGRNPKYASWVHGGAASP